MEFKKEINIGSKIKEFPVHERDKSRYYNPSAQNSGQKNYQKSNVEFNYQNSNKLVFYPLSKQPETRCSIRTKSSIDQQNPALMKVMSDDSYKPKKNSVAKVKMIKEMYKKNPINNPISVEENNYNDSNSKKALRVNGYMNSSGLMSNLQQIHVEDDCSEAVSKKNKKRNQYVEPILLKQSRAINDQKMSFLKNSKHRFEGKTGFYY